jgi:hypothetical protein
MIRSVDELDSHSRNRRRRHRPRRPQRGPSQGWRPVGNTHLMTAARICLGIFLVIVALIAFGVFK